MPAPSNPLANGTVLTGIADASNNAYVVGSAGAGFRSLAGSLKSPYYWRDPDAIAARIDTTLSAVMRWSSGLPILAVREPTGPTRSLSVWVASKIAIHTWPAEPLGGFSDHLRRGAGR